MTAVSLVQIRVNDQSQRQKEKSHDGNDNAVVDAGEEVAEEPQQDDGYPWEGNCEYCK